MSAVLEVYEKLIGQMLKELPNPSPQPQEVGDASESGANDDVRAELSYILDKVQKLRENHFHEEGKLLEELHRLKDIQVRSQAVKYDTKPILWYGPKLRRMQGLSTQTVSVGD